MAVAEGLDSGAIVIYTYIHLFNGTEVASCWYYRGGRASEFGLGDSIVVTVVKVAGDRVRLGIEAPADMLVLRGELERRQAKPPPPLRASA